MESRWTRRLGLGTIVAAGLALAASTASGAGDPLWDPPACAGPLPTATGEAVGAWYRLDGVMDDGALTGQEVALGSPDGGTRTIGLARESFAAGPFGGRILIGEDDGTRSRLRLVDPDAACAWDVATSDDVIRRATLTPDGSAVIEFLVERSTRADLGVFERRLGGRDAPVRILEPIDPDPRFGPTWTTELAWGIDGRDFVVQSCGERACRTRVVDRIDGRQRTLADPGMADMIGFADGRLVAYAACGGLPCPLLVVAMDTGVTTTLHDEAGAAVLTRDAHGRPVVVHEIGADGAGLRAVGLDGRRAAPLVDDPAGRRLVAGPGRTGSAAEIADGTILLAPDGRVPLDGTLGPTVRWLTDDLRTPKIEVDR